MPLPQLGLSLSMTDDTKKTSYSRYSETHHMADFDSEAKQHVITIKITEEEVGTAKVTTLSENGKGPERIELPTYKLVVNDTKTDEPSVYHVTRDALNFKNQKEEKKSRFSLFGYNLFGKNSFKYANVPFEPLKSSLEKFKAIQYRKLNEDRMIYSIEQKSPNRQAYICAGKIDPESESYIKNKPIFWVLDDYEGQQFIRDIKSRELFIKSIPEVEVYLIGRNKFGKEFEVNKKGKVNKIIYL